MNPPINIKAILFDFDGTLVQSIDCALFVTNTLLQQHERPIIDTAEMTMLLEGGILAVIQHCFPDTQDFHSQQQLINAFQQLWLQSMVSHTHFFPDLLSTLQCLTKQDFPWGIVSNRPRKFAQPLVDHYQLKQLSNSLIWIEESADKKPNPIALLKACQQLKVAPQQTLYIGDNLTDMQAAQAANMPFAFAHYGHCGTPIPSPLPYAHLQLDTPNDLNTYLNQYLVAYT